MEHEDSGLDDEDSGVKYEDRKKIHTQAAATVKVSKPVILTGMKLKKAVFIFFFQN